MEIYDQISMLETQQITSSFELNLVTRLLGPTYIHMYVVRMLVIIWKSFFRTIRPFFSKIMHVAKIDEVSYQP